MLSSSRRIVFLFLLCVLHTVSRAAFTMLTCGSDPSGAFCVQKNTAGTWCFASTAIIESTNCTTLPYSVMLEAHLKQDLSIAYYSPTAERLGGVDYPVPASTIVYVCMTAQVVPGQYYSTICALARGDNGWGSGCQVNLAPSHVSDGCYGTAS